jgi:hypothetical protein
MVQHDMYSHALEVHIHSKKNCWNCPRVAQVTATGIMASQATSSSAQPSISRHSSLNTMYNNKADHSVLRRG